MAVQGSVITWVADHRKHHAFTDQEGDPHSPHLCGPGFKGAIKGLWHAHIGWLFETVGTAERERFAPDLVKDGACGRWTSSSGVGRPSASRSRSRSAGSSAAALGTALDRLLWGGLVRIFLLHHVTWSINSVCHFFGRKRFDVEDESRNVFWLAPLSMGEAWHHNHHAFPTSAFHGLRFWERLADPTGLVIACSRSSASSGTSSGSAPTAKRPRRCRPRGAPRRSPSPAPDLTLSRVRPFHGQRRMRGAGMATMAADVRTDVRARVTDLDWHGLEAQLDDVGHAVTPGLLCADECATLAALFDGDGFRSTIDMARHRFGDGRYRYFDHPLPRRDCSPARRRSTTTGAVANRWGERLLGDKPVFPPPTWSCSSAAATPGRRARRRSCSATRRRLERACTRTSTARSSSPSRSSPSSRAAAWTTRAASSCCSSSARAHRAARTCSSAAGGVRHLPTRERPGQGPTGYHRSGCATASRRSPRAAHRAGVIFHDAR